MVNEERLENETINLAMGTLAMLRKLYEEEGLDDRKATLSLYYFLNTFVKVGWKGNKPSKIFKEAITIAKSTNQDNIIELDNGT